MRPSVELRAAERQARLDQEKERGLQRLMRDMDLTPEGSTAPRTDEPAEEEIEQEYEGDGQIIDPDADEEKPDAAFNLLSSRPGLTPGRAYGEDGTVWPRTS